MGGGGGGGGGGGSERFPTESSVVSNTTYLSFSLAKKEERQSLAQLCKFRYNHNSAFSHAIGKLHIKMATPLVNRK